MISSDKIKTFRIRQGWSQRQLAQQIGRTVQVISNWERGVTRVFDTDDIDNLAKAFGVTALELMSNNADCYESHEPAITFLREVLSDEPELRKIITEAQDYKKSAFIYRGKQYPISEITKEIIKLTLKGDVGSRN